MHLVSDMDEMKHYNKVNLRFLKMASKCYNKLDQNRVEEASN